MSLARLRGLKEELMTWEYSCCSLRMSGELRMVHMRERWYSQAFVKSRIFIRHMLQFYPGGHHPDYQGNMSPLPSSTLHYIGVAMMLRARDP